MDRLDRSAQSFCVPKAEIAEQSYDLLRLNRSLLVFLDLAC